MKGMKGGRGMKGPKGMKGEKGGAWGPNQWMKGIDGQLKGNSGWTAAGWTAGLTEKMKGNSGWSEAAWTANTKCGKGTRDKSMRPHMDKPDRKG